MPSDEYSAVTKGGLKLKGVVGSKVDKKKKKKRPKDESSAAAESPAADAPANKDSPARDQTLDKALAEEDRKLSDAEGEQATPKNDRGTGRTEAEKRHEERRRKRLDERLKREGIKTHKERVEELNRYLSGLSEHHDMPRIGPG